MLKSSPLDEFKQLCKEQWGKAMLQETLDSTNFHQAIEPHKEFLCLVWQESFFTLMQEGLESSLSL